MEKESERRGRRVENCESECVPLLVSAPGRDRAPVDKEGGAVVEAAGVGIHKVQPVEPRVPRRQPKHAARRARFTE